MAVTLPVLPNYSLPNPANYYDVGALNREVGNTAAARAVGMGIPNSPFARNLGTALRFSEQQRFLQPYLEREQQSAMQAAQIGAQQQLAERESAAAMQRLQAQLAGQADIARLEQEGALQRIQAQTAAEAGLRQLEQGGAMERLRAQLGAEGERLNQQIAAESASLAIREAGLERRLGIEASNALSLATLRGNQEMAERILIEAGADRRQASALAADLQRTTLQLQEERLRTLLPFIAERERSRRERIPAPWTGPRTIPAGISPVTASGEPVIPMRPQSAPNFSPVIGQGVPVNRAQTMQDQVTNILQQYGVPTGGTSTATAAPDPYAMYGAPNVITNVPGYSPEFEWGNRPSAPNSAALQAYYE